MLIIFSSPDIWLAVGFVLALSLYESLIFPHMHRPFAERLPLTWRIVAQIISYVLILIYFLASFTSMAIVRAIYFLLFIAGILAEYGVMSSMGRYSAGDDYHMGLELIDDTLYKNAVGSYIGRMWPALFPILTYAFLLVITWHHQSGNGLSLVAILSSILLFYSVLYPFCSGTFHTLAFSSSWRSLTFTIWKYVTTYRGPRLAVQKQGSEPPKNNIVFIVDESIRGDHLSVNGYDRSTTPFLEELRQQGVLYTWGVAVSGGTSSVNGNALLLTGVNLIPDVSQQVRRMPTIFAYAQAMGYKTYYLDVQMNKLWLMRRDDLNSVDVWVTARDFDGGTPYLGDLNAAHYIDDLIQSTTGNFIWVNKMGAHFPYIQRVPPGIEIWKPILRGIRYNPSQKAEIINSYDNILAYNLEMFFREIVKPETLQKTVFVYTSDHGQTLSENGETWPQTGPTRNEAIVPILLITREPLKVDTKFRAHHMNLFATLLDLMRYPQTDRIYSYSTSLLQAHADDSAPRHYIFGDLNSDLRSRVYEFDKR
jgi:glucan phosphoethanolaminetransferase (alkaline phosphatase superfamily)